ncbi:sensor histidine kinase [Dichotomicrobium thermohalophilum]|uniref:histidine kinase n=1 Tax=Dichotomicrobium thermohalophilum TaxID=933063 RepID=A0A397PII7_9HYPH|nr:HAMP domain-containing sensor histidine kinase [Dichotomicrobium thermohalophilum]RIA47699.1 signal transduction histidine kinase [Dichotomicrobium thermohalophilum]
MTVLLPGTGAKQDGESTTSETSNGAERKRRVIRMGLSAKLLWLTILFVMIAEVLIFVPSVANYRKNWLGERLMAARIAALSVEAAPVGTLPQDLRSDLLDTAKVEAVALKREDFRSLLLERDMPSSVDASYDLRDASWLTLIGDALHTFIAPDGRMIRVIGPVQAGDGAFIEIILDESLLKAAMVRYGLNILALSLLISLIAATLVYISLNGLLVKPISRLTQNMVAFGEDPEDPARAIAPSRRSDEIGIVESELADMQGQLTNLLRQKSRLAALGLAVSKINHDLRNMLSSAQLISDRMGSIPDPTVQRFAPKLIASLDRAIRLCSDTLKYGRSEEPPPERERFPLRPLIEEVGDALMLPREGIAWHIDVPAGLDVYADRDQIYRVVANLVRNACEALEESREAHEALVTVTARRHGDMIRLQVSDTGPGIPAKAQENLFAAFRGSVRNGGTGLGLAIASELVRAHGGRIELADNSAGATFRIELPDSADRASHQENS